MAVKVKEYREEAQKDQSVLWPHIQKLGDCLRCTIECQSGEEVWQTWEQVEEHFEVKTGAPPADRSHVPKSTSDHERTLQ